MLIVGLMMRMKIGRIPHVSNSNNFVPLPIFLPLHIPPPPYSLPICCVCVLVSQSGKIKRFMMKHQRQVRRISIESN